MNSFFSFVQFILFWPFIIFVFLVAIAILARFFIKDPTMEKKRIFLFYSFLGIAMSFLFLLSLVQFFYIRLEDLTVWNLVVVLSGTGVAIMSFFVFNSYSEFWLQPKKGKAK